MPLSPVIAVLINNGAAIVAEMNGFRPLLGPEGWRKLLARRQKGAVLPVEAHLPILLPPAEAQPANGHSQNGFHAQTVSVASMGQNGNGSSNGSYEAIATEADPVKRTNGSNGGSPHSTRRKTLAL
jgi:Cu2+-exporting ATPase